MDQNQNEYYYEMAKRDRLMMFHKNNKLQWFVTYYIGNGNSNKYIRNDPWTVLDDEPKTGTICYIDQLIANGDKINPRRLLEAFSYFTDLIKSQFPRVEHVRWNRFKNGKVFVYRKYLSRKEQLCTR